MIELVGVTKTFRKRGADVRALGGVDLHVAEGEFVVIKGPSGSGKSTLLLTIGAMSRPSSGAVRVGTSDVLSLPDAARARFRAENIGFVFQMFHLVPYLSVLDNVALPTKLTKQHEGRGRARELLCDVGLEGRLSHFPSELSTGERQRAALARALVNRPRIILADEPTGNLDPENGTQVLEHLAAYHRDGGTVLVVTHEQWIEPYAQRVVTLRDGCLQGTSSRA